MRESADHRSVGGGEVEGGVWMMSSIVRTRRVRSVHTNAAEPGLCTCMFE